MPIIFHVPQFIPPTRFKTYIAIILIRYLIPNAEAERRYILPGRQPGHQGRGVAPSPLPHAQSMFPQSNS